jgi:3-isopropylmalate/(R)-2-methylmalate dehydratase large subunit
LPRTLLDKIWSSHAVLTRADGATLLHIDRHFVHDGSGNAFRMLREKGLTMRRPDRTFATPDHYVSTISHDLASINEPHRRSVVEALESNATAAGFDNAAPTPFVQRTRTRRLNLTEAA